MVIKGCEDNNHITMYNEILTVSYKIFDYLNPPLYTWASICMHTPTQSKQQTHTYLQREKIY